MAKQASAQAASTAQGMAVRGLAYIVDVGQGVLMAMVSDCTFRSLHGHDAPHFCGRRAAIQLRQGFWLGGAAAPTAAHRLPLTGGDRLEFVTACPLRRETAYTYNKHSA